MMSHTQNRGYMEMFHTIINVRKIYPNGMATLKKKMDENAYCAVLKNDRIIT